MRKTVTVYECDHCGAPLGSTPPFITVNYKNALHVSEYEGSEFHYCQKCGKKVSNYLEYGGFVINENDTSLEEISKAFTKALFNPSSTNDSLPHPYVSSVPIEGPF